MGKHGDGRNITETERKGKKIREKLKKMYRRSAAIYVDEKEVKYIIYIYIVIMKVRKIQNIVKISIHNILLLGAGM